MTAFVIDDSIYSRNRSKSVELLAKVFDHSTKRTLKGFQLLTLGWTDSATFIPVDFALMSSAKKVSLDMDIFKSQMTKWLAALPSYFKQCLDISGCES